MVFIVLVGVVKWAAGRAFDLTTGSTVADVALVTVVLVTGLVAVVGVIVVSAESAFTGVAGVTVLCEIWQQHQCQSNNNISE